MCSSQIQEKDPTLTGWQGGWVVLALGSLLCRNVRQPPCSLAPGLALGGCLSEARRDFGAVEGKAGGPEGPFFVHDQLMRW